MYSLKASCLCLCLCIASVSAALFAVDLGSEYIKVSVVKPGRVPISIVHNELSKRKTPAAVAFESTTRLYGENAVAFTSKKPDRVFLRIRDFLGRHSDDPFLENLFGGDLRWKPAHVYIQDATNGTIEFDIGDGASVTVEEILAGLFSYIKGITHEEAGEAVVDCVIAVPAFFGPAQKRRLEDAAKLAEINVLAIIHAHAAAALQYGIDRQFNITPESVLIYDMGANTIQVSLLSFSAYEGMQIGKKVMVGQFEVVDVVWYDNLGGDHIDWKLVHYFAQRFNQKHLVDIYTSSRAIWKLKKAVGKTKLILSANTEAHLSVEEIFDGKDFSDKITRAEFDRMNLEFFEKAVEPLKAILQRNHVNISDLRSVELIGGGSRVPGLQAALSEALDGRSLDKHLDGDEAVVMGAGLVAANLSTIFRLRKFGCLDGIIYPMFLQVMEPDGRQPVDDAVSFFKPKAILPYMKKLPSRRIVSLYNVSEMNALDFQIRFNDSYPLPAGVKNDIYANYTINGLKDAMEKWGVDGKIVLHVLVDLSGLVTVDRAEYVVDIVKFERPQEALSPGAPVNDTGNDENQNPNAPPPETEHNITAPPAVEEKPEKTVKRSIDRPFELANEVPLALSAANYSQPSMSKEQLKASKAVLKKYTKGEALRKKTEEAKNTLETYIVRSRNQLRENYEVLDVTNQTQREEFLQLLEAAEDWLYMDGADSTADVFGDKLKELDETGEPIFGRAAESVNRPLSVEKARKSLDIILMAVNSWPDIRPWIKEDLVELGKEARDFDQWLRNKQEEQSQREPHETPVFTSINVLRRLVKVERIMTRISNKKQPKPKLSPSVNATESNQTNQTAEGIPIGNTTVNETLVIGDKKETEVQSEKPEHIEFTLSTIVAIYATGIDTCPYSPSIRVGDETGTLVWNQSNHRDGECEEKQKDKGNVEDIAKWRTGTDEGRKLLAQGRILDAEVSFQSALSASLRAFGLDAPHVAMSANNLAEVYRVLGKTAQAKDLYAQAMETLLLHYGEEDPRTALALHNYAAVLVAMRQSTEAQKAAERAFRVMKELYGSERTETLQTQYLLARCLIGADSRTVENGQLASDVICLLLEMGDNRGIQSLWEFVSGVFEEASEEDLRRIQQICDRLVDVFLANGQNEAALDVVRTLDIYLRRVLNRETLSLAACLRRRAQIHFENPAGREGLILGLAVEGFDVAWRLFQTKFKEKVPNIGDKILQLWKRFKEAPTEEILINTELFNCLYELTLSVTLLHQLLANNGAALTGEDEEKLQGFLKRYLGLFELKENREILEQFRQDPQFEAKVKKIETANTFCTHKL